MFDILLIYLFKFCFFKVSIDAMSPSDFCKENEPLEHQPTVDQNGNIVYPVHQSTHIQSSLIYDAGSFTSSRKSTEDLDLNQLPSDYDGDLDLNQLPAGFAKIIDLNQYPLDTD